MKLRRKGLRRISLSKPVTTEEQVRWPRNATEQEKQDAINETIKRIEAKGGYIVGAAPEERIYSVIVGRNFTVEYPQGNNEEVKADD